MGEVQQPRNHTFIHLAVLTLVFLSTLLLFIPSPASAERIELPVATSQFDSRLIDTVGDLLEAVINEDSEALSQLIHPEWGLVLWQQPGAFILPTRWLGPNGNLSELFSSEMGALTSPWFEKPEVVRVRLGKPVAYDCSKETYRDPGVVGIFRLDHPKLKETIIGSFIDLVSQNPSAFGENEIEEAVAARELGVDFRLTYHGEGHTLRFYFKRDANGRYWLIHLAEWTFCSA